MTPRKLLVGNWKLNLLKAQAIQLVDELLCEINRHCEEAEPTRPSMGPGLLRDARSDDAKISSTLDIAIAPVATLLGYACEKTQGTALQVAAQNVFHESQGAYTGEWSVAHLKELGVSMAIVGHSERRHYFGDTDELVALKSKACLAQDVTPVVCIGESLKQREKNQTLEILVKQIQGLPKDSRMVVAYEPIWAIGTGQHAMRDQVAEVHGFLKAQLGAQIRLLYGGSVNEKNAQELAQVPGVDGFLVGGASLNAKMFFGIGKAFI